MSKKEDRAPDAVVHFDQLPDSANVRLQVVCSLRGYSIATVYRKSKAGKLPPVRKVSERISAMNVGELRKAFAEEDAEVAA
jgi:predicted DNA-binding transcriptional regulator AlpA